MLLLLALPAHATCTTLFDDDLTDGSSDGDRSGGHFDADGWWSEGGTTVYDFPVPVASGRFELELAGLEEDGLGQNDLAEMFTAHGGSFSDGESHSFLQLKMAGDIYGGYDGRVKMHIGGEYGDEELAMWSDERDWNPDDVHTIAVSWGDGYVWMEHDGDVVAEVDYSTYNAGYVPFETLRLPNDGWYAYDPVLSELRFRHVWICGEDVEPPEAPSIDSFDVQPRELGFGEPFALTWSAGGDVSGVEACGQARTTGTLLCTDLGAASGTFGVGSDALSVDTWDIWITASGAGGDVRSGTVSLTVHEAGWVADPVDTGTADTGTVVDSGSDEPQDSRPRTPRSPGQTTELDEVGCGCESGAGAPGGLCMVIAALALQRRRPGTRGR